MKKTIFIFLVVLILGVGGCIQNPSPTPTSSPKPIVEKDFTLPDIQGNPFTLSDHLGEPILLCFFMADCPACQNEVPHLNAIQKKYQQSQQLLVIGIGIRSGIPEFIQTYRVEYLVLRDDEQETVSDLYGVSSVPHNVFINRQGQIVRQIAKSLTTTELENYVKEIL
jgi:peroxiredoxin